MARAAGRDQIGPMERLIRLLICLSDAGDKGVPVRRLLQMADLEEDTDANRAQLRRHLSVLRQGGWDVRNVASEGEEGRYVLHVRDNRLAIVLTPGERAVLRRVYLDAESDLASPPWFLGGLQHAVADRCLTHFTYQGVQRAVHPYGLHVGTSGWVLSGREADARAPEEFVVAWMADVDLDDPGTSEPGPDTDTRASDPLDWEMDPPMTVTMSTPVEYLGDVLRLISGGQVISAEDGQVVVSRRVTNQVAFRSRLYELGLRAKVVGPPELVTEVVDNLRAVARGHP